MRDIPHWILSNYHLTTLLFTSQTIQTSAMSNPHVTAGSCAVFEADNVSAHVFMACFDFYFHPQTFTYLMIPPFTTSQIMLQEQLRQSLPLQYEYKTYSCYV